MRKIFTLILFGSTILTVAQVPGNQLFDNSKIHEIKITSLYESLTDTLTKNYVLSFGFGQIQIRKVPYTTSLITIDGTPLDTIGIRYKGFNSWWSSVKKPIKLDLNKYKDQDYDGLSKINLHNGAGDPSFIRENIGYSVMRSLGIKAPRTSYAKVYMDETYLGLYRLVEQIDNTFLDVNFGNHDGNLYVQQSKGSGGYSLDWFGNNQEDYYESLELENHQKANDWSSLIHFLDILNNTSDATFKNEIQSVFSVDEYLEILAFDVAVNNIDWYGGSGRNYYIAEVDGKFHWIPWDYNLSWREDAKAVNIDPKEYPVLIKRILNVPEFYNSFIRKYCSLIPQLSSTSFNALITNEAAAIKSLIEIDPQLEYSFEAFETNTETSWGSLPGMKEFAAQRYTDITRTLESLEIDCSVTTGTPGDEETSLKLYPIPARDVLFVGSFHTDETQASVFNNLGQEVLNSLVSENGSIDVSTLLPGCYVLKLNDGGRMYSKLFVVERY